MRWHALLPARVGGKSRLTLPGDWSSACALDTLAALSDSPSIESITILGDLATDLPTIADNGGGLNNEIGKAAISLPRPLLVILGDLPALKPDQLEQALHQAAAQELAFVRDMNGSGTTMIMVQGDFTSHFGQRSAELHNAAGYTEIDAAESVRCDVDTIDDLHRARTLGLGLHTTSLLDGQ